MLIGRTYEVRCPRRRQVWASRETSFWFLKFRKCWLVKHVKPDDQRATRCEHPEKCRFDVFKVSQVSIRRKRQICCRFRAPLINVTLLAYEFHIRCLGSMSGWSNFHLFWVLFCLWCFIFLVVVVLGFIWFLVACSFYYVSWGAFCILLSCVCCPMFFVMLFLVCVDIVLCFWVFVFCFILWFYCVFDVAHAYLYIYIYIYIYLYICIYIYIYIYIRDS